VVSSNGLGGVFVASCAGHPSIGRSVFQAQFVFDRTVGFREFLIGKHDDNLITPRLRASPLCDLPSGIEN
jgi:hypothetical protein